MAESFPSDGTSGSAEAAMSRDQHMGGPPQLMSGAGDGEGNIPHDDAYYPPDHGEAEADARDGNPVQWQELEEDDQLSEGELDSELKGMGVGEENPDSWASPYDSQQLVQGQQRDQTGRPGHDRPEVIFSPARVLNFDDSDGDDLSAVDQKFIPRAVFEQLESMEHRPEINGSEEVDYSPGRGAAAMGDHSQNVRIIEGHDDLELDQRAGYMSLAMRNKFLQTQVVSLPPLSPNQHNLSTTLYDSLEREEEDAYPEEYEHEEDEDSHQRGEDQLSLGDRDFACGEDGNRLRDVQSLYGESHWMMNDAFVAGLNNQDSFLERPDLSNGGLAEDSDSVGQRSPARQQFSASPASSPQRSEQDRRQHPPHQQEHSWDNRAEHHVNLTEAAPKTSSSGQSTMPPSEGSAMVEAAKPDVQRPLSARPKQPAQQRGGPAGSNGSRRNNPGGKVPSRGNSQPPRGGAEAGSAVHPRDPTDAGQGQQNRAAADSPRQASRGAQTQRPAVQGAAVAAAGLGGGGDGDGAAGGRGGQGHPTLTLLSSRTSSQASIHSLASNNSNSRVSGVGKESNPSRHPQAQRATGAFPGRPAANQQATVRGPATTSSSAQPPQQRQQQPPPPSNPTRQPSGRPARNPASAPVAAASHPEPGQALRRRDNRTVQLRQQHSRLQQEQLELRHRQHQLQQEHQLHQQQQRRLEQQQQQQQQHQDGAGMESPDGDHLDHHHHHVQQQQHHHQMPEAVVTQVAHVQHESLVEERVCGGAGSEDVQGMEELRSVLHGMMRLQKEQSAFGDHNRGFDYADSASDLLMERQPMHYDTDNNSLSGLRAVEDVAEMFEGFPNFSYKMFSDVSAMSGTSDRSAHSELAYLRDCLEKERYRRKHCEQQIQSLNVKLLELQQQLAVAVSTDRRKDVMIDQLDKQLARVVEGWKKRDVEKDEYLQMALKDKAHIEETLHKQQAVIDSFEKEMTQTVQELKQEKETSASLLDTMKEELSAATHKQRHAEELLAAEKERVALMEKEWDQLKESRDLAEKRAQQAQEVLHREQDGWFQSRQEFQQKIDDVKEANLKVMQMERVKLEERTKKAEDLEDRLHSAEAEIKRLELELDSARREKESLKVEMALTEAKYESAQRSLEADLQAQMEKKVTEEVCAAEERVRQQLEEQEEQQRQRVCELHQRHQQDLDAQLSSLRHQTHAKEAQLKAEAAQLEDRLSEMKQENAALRQAKQRLESQRIEVLSKLQYIMQSQWNEAVSLLVTTPQRKTLNTSLSGLSCGLQGSGSAQGSGAAFGTVPGSSAPMFLPPSLSNARLSADVTAGSLPSNAKQGSHQDQHRQISDMSTFNNLSGSQSSHSSGHSLPNATATSTGLTQASNHATDPKSRTEAQSLFTDPKTRTEPQSLFTADAGLSLQEISALLSGAGGNLPPNLTSSVHGVTHSGGLLVNMAGGNYREERLPYSDAQWRDGEGGGASRSQAVLIRPPQQRESTSEGADPGCSFLSDGSQGSGQAEGRKGGTSNNNGAQAQNLGRKDRSLQMSDLDPGSGQGQDADLLMVNRCSADGGSNNTFGTSVPAYLPSMSPPVKQGRGGDHDSVDGDVQQENDRLNSSYREISRQLEQHQSRQRELQHYIRLLLEKAPQGVNECPERDESGDPDALNPSVADMIDFSTMDLSLNSVNLDLGMSDDAQSAQLGAELQRLQELRDRQTMDQQQQTSSHQAPPTASPSSSSHRLRPSTSSHRMHPSSSRRSQAPPPAPSQQPLPPGAAQPPAAESDAAANLQPQQLVEIWRLLGQYSEDVAANNAAVQQACEADPVAMTQILNYLATLPHQQLEEGSQPASVAKNSVKPQNTTRRTRESHRPKSTRHHSAGPDTSGSSIPTSEKQERGLASSGRSSNHASSSSASRRSVERKASAATSAPNPLAVRQSVRAISKEQTPAWKAYGKRGKQGRTRREINPEWKD